MKSLSLSHLKSDLLAGVVVFLVALPLCLGIATASGVDPFAGLISGIIGGLVVALLSGSQLSVSGPAAGLVVIVVESIARLGSFSAFLTAVLLAGVFQLILGMMKAGKLASYIPSSVIKGMLAAIGLLLIIKQFPLALGIPKDFSGVEFTFNGIRSLFGAMSLTAIFVSMSGLFLLFAWETPALKRFAIVRSIPGPLAVVILGVGVTLWLDMWAPSLAPPAGHRVLLPEFNSFSEFTSALQLPDISQLMVPDVWRVAITLAIVASLETLLSLEAVEQLDPKKRIAPPNQELKAQGIGNVIAGSLGGLPLTAVIVRSSANVNAGAKSRMSAIIHGLLLLTSVFLLTDIINLIPLACLAAILLHTGYKLTKPALIASIAKEGKDRFLPFIITIIGVVTTDLLMGIAIGLMSALILAIKAHMQSALILARYDDHYLLTFRKDVSFLGKVKLKRFLSEIKVGSKLIIDMTRADYVDHEVYELLNRFAEKAKVKNIPIEYRVRTPECHSAGLNPLSPASV